MTSRVKLGSSCCFVPASTALAVQSLASILTPLTSTHHGLRARSIWAQRSALSRHWTDSHGNDAFCDRDTSYLSCNSIESVSLLEHLVDIVHSPRGPQHICDESRRVNIHIGLSNHQEYTLCPCPQCCKVAPFYPPSTRHGMRSAHRNFPDYTVYMHYACKGPPSSLIDLVANIDDHSLLHHLYCQLYSTLNSLSISLD